MRHTNIKITGSEKDKLLEYFEERFDYLYSHKSENAYFYAGEMLSLSGAVNVLIDFSNNEYCQVHLISIGGICTTRILFSPSERKIASTVIEIFNKLCRVKNWDISVTEKQLRTPLDPKGLYY